MTLMPILLAALILLPRSLGFHGARSAQVAAQSRNFAPRCHQSCPALRAACDDVVGAGRGWILGPVVQMLSTLRLPKSAAGHVSQVKDRRVLAKNDTILNRSRFAKFGIPVTQTFTTMRRVPA